jgi:hypothetical protein
MSFIYQNITLQKLIELLEKKSSKVALNLSSLPEELLSSLNIPVSAELGTTNVPTKDLIHIEEGDLVSLEQRLDEPIVLKIGNVTSFKVQPGIKNNHVAVRMLKSGSRKILGEQIEKIDMDKPSPPALQAQLDTAIPKKEDTMLPGNANAEEFELPLEEETKEEYNENEENIFGEEQSPEKHGGV